MIKKQIIHLLQLSKHSIKNILNGYPKIFLINMLIISIGSIISYPTFAEEEAVVEKEKSEEGKEENGGFIKKDEYLELNSSIEQLSAKIRVKNENLKKMLLDKDHVKDPVAFKEMVKQIEVEYREINEMAESIEKKKIVLRHRFPERSFVKNADKSKVQQIEEIGIDAVIEKQMEQLLKLVESQYKMPVRLKPAPEKSKRDPASKDSSPTPAIEQDPEDFSHSLILKK